MDRTEAIELLPPAYAVALRLADAGASDDLIAAGAGVDPTSVPALIRLARAKLAEAMTGSSSADHA
jgi:DNA-directed RNA polymerase specialized sigma24 family protein